MNLLIKRHLVSIRDYFANGAFMNHFRKAPLAKNDKIIIKFDIDPDTLLRSKKQTQDEDSE